LLFCFQLKFLESGENKKAKSRAHRTGKKPRQQNVPQATLHNVILCNSSIFKGVRNALYYLRVCISTLCKIAAHGAKRVGAHLTPFGQGRGHRRKVRSALNYFNEHPLSAP
jgi:hypothetical protein